MRWCVVVVLVAACGRIGFDPSGGGGGGGDGGGSDAAAQTCVVPTASVDWLASNVPNEPGLPNAASYTATATVVADKISGLTWERGQDSSLVAWNEAQAYCAGLSLDGCNAWRVPQRSELASLVDHTRSGIDIDPSFPQTPVDTTWWSGTTLAGSVNNAWVVNFINGNTFDQLKTDLCHVRCVYGALGAAPPARYMIPGDGTVIDLDTKLVWQRTVDAGSYSWNAAATYCTTTALPGTGWRVPSVRELESIIDSTQQSPPIDGTTFPATPKTGFWTSTIFVDGNSTAMIVNLSDGTVQNEADSVQHAVRCVR